MMLHEFWRTNPILYKKDVVISVGTVLDTLGGIGSRDYNSDWKVNCEKSRAMFAESVLEDHCTQYGYDAHTSIRFDDDCRDAGHKPIVQNQNTNSTENESLEIIQTAE